MKPLTTLQSLLFFGASALLFRLSVYNLMPLLLAKGMPPFWAFIISYSLPLTAFIVATFLLVRREGNLPVWQQRLRLTKLTGKQV